jgi:hypothetical protein
VRAKVADARDDVKRALNDAHLESTATKHFRTDKKR